MTRETKVGLIVAGSFLCLVCVVVASKMRHGDDPVKGGAEEQTINPGIAAVNPKQTAPPPEVKKKDEQPKREGPPAKKEGTIAPPQGRSETPPTLVFPPLAQAAPPKDVQPTLVLPPPTTENPKPAPTLVLPPPPTENPKPANVEFPKPADTPPTFPTLPVAKDTQPTFPALPAPKDAAPMVPTFPAAKDAPPTFPAITPKEVTPVNKPFNEKDPPPPLTIPKDTAPTFPPIAPKDPTPMVPTFPAAKDGPPTFPTLPKDTAVPVVPPLGLPTPLEGTKINPPPSIAIPSDPIKPGIAVVPGDPQRPTGPIPTIPSNNELPNTPRVAPTLVDPFVKMQNPNARPMPIIRDTDIHVCQQGDTNFAVLSQKLYGTDKYAQALLRYNRDNYKATVNGKVFLDDAPTLLPGQQVHVAPVSILDRDYLSVRPVSTTPVPTIPSATAPPVLSKPLPLNPNIAAVTNPAAGSNQARSYVVQNPAGESILDIAERVMGDRGQWHKIWRVNPSYPPQNRIPAGTKLEIPAN